MIGGLELTPYLMIAGLGVALLVSVTFFHETVRIPATAATGRAGRTWQVLITPTGIFAWPLVGIGVAFLISGAVNLVWMLVVGLLVTGLAVEGLRTLRYAHQKRADPAPTLPGPVAAVFVALLALLEFHWLLVVRLAVAPDPDGGLVDGLGLDALAAGAQAIVLPAVGLGVLLFALRVGESLFAWMQVRYRRLPRRARRYGPAVLLFALFAAPAVPYLGGSAQLTFVGIATPEFGKVLYFWVLACVVARLAVTSGARRVGRRRWWPSPRLTWPTGLFLLVGLGSAIRKDLGPLIPVFAGTLGMMWCALRDEADREVAALPTVGERRQEGARMARRSFLSDLKIPLLIILVFVGFGLTSDYVQVRLDVRLHAWDYNWNALCVDPPPRMLDVPTGPDGSDVCLRSLLSAAAGDRSQVAKAVAAVADGGLWGRGLRDSRSRIVPLSATDFVIAALWNKLGGLVVMGAGALLAMLAFALSRAVWRLHTGGEPDRDLPPAARPPRLFAAGVTTSLLGQYLFVLFATLNWVPHSGITAPFLSRGGQSTLALAVGVVLALAAASAGRTGARAPFDAGTPEAEAPEPGPFPPPRQPSRLGVVLVVAVLVAATALITVRPYGGYREDRPLCLAGQAVNDPRTCTTDLLALGRTRVEIGFPDGSRFSKLQADPEWTRTAGSGPDPAALGGLLQVPGSQAGLVDLGLPTVLGATRGTSLADRLAPHVTNARPDSFVELTFDPALQVAATHALTTDGTPDAPPLAGGAVVLDARTGQLLAAASAPQSIPDPSGPPLAISPDALRAFTDAHPYSQLGPTGLAPYAADKCRIESVVEDNDPTCYRYFPTSRARKAVDGQRAEEQRYVGPLAGDPLARLPKATTNRATGELYGPGSTFKVITAAAYLAMPDTSPDDQIPTKTELDIGGKNPIRNANRGPCFGARGGEITLRQALAVSCNTAFVALAQRIGWDRVRDMAVAFGFHVGTADADQDSALGAVPALQASVPESAVGPDIGNVALGGGAVVSTPLEMASVMATIANGGQRVEPTMATLIRAPGMKDGVPVRSARSNPVGSQEAVALRSALQDTTSERAHGTARKLHAPDGRPLWVKTGTDALYPDEMLTPAHHFVRQIAWLAGFFDTAQGPAAFAVAVETSDQDQGGARARAVASEIIAAVVARRG